MKFKDVGIIGMGTYVPEKIVTNFDFEKTLDTNDEWIRTRTGIEERRFVAADQATSDLAVEAAKEALAKSGDSIEDIEMIIVATCTPDYPTQSTACLVQEKLGAKNAAALCGPQNVRGVRDMRKQMPGPGPAGDPGHGSRGVEDTQDPDSP